MASPAPPLADASALTRRLQRRLAATTLAALRGAAALEGERRDDALVALLREVAAPIEADVAARLQQGGCPATRYYELIAAFLGGGGDADNDEGSDGEAGAGALFAALPPLWSDDVLPELLCLLLYDRLLGRGRP